MYFCSSLRETEKDRNTESHRKAFAKKGLLLLLLRAFGKLEWVGRGGGGDVGGWKRTSICRPQFSPIGCRRMTFTNRWTEWGDKKSFWQHVHSLAEKNAVSFVCFWGSNYIALYFANLTPFQSNPFRWDRSSLEKYFFLAVSIKKMGRNLAKKGHLCIFSASPFFLAKCMRHAPPP